MKNEEGKDQSATPVSESIHIGGSVGPGTAIGAGARVEAQNIAGRDVSIGTDATTVAEAFSRIYEAIEARSFSDEGTAEGIKDAVAVIQSENDKGDEGNETSLRFSFKMLAQMAPDIFDVIVSTLTNPILGISTAVRKIAQKAKDEFAYMQQKSSNADK